MVLTPALKHAIILAGGLSTRLPNKLLLPVRKGIMTMPCIAGVLTTVRQAGSGFDVITIALRDKEDITTSVIKKFLEWDRPLAARVKLVFVPEGVLPALARSSLPYVENWVFCGDNVYDEDDVAAMLPGEAACVWVDNRDRREQLDFYNGNRFRPRQYLDVDYRGSLATPWSFPPGMLVGADRYSSVVELLNATHLTPRQCTGAWSDIGTPQAYREHWA